MKVSDLIFLGDDAKTKIIAGINKLANAVKVTLGPGGRFVALRGKDGKIIITKDGVTVAKYTELSDPIEDMGAQIVKDPANGNVETVGDGTTTATVITQALVNGHSNITNVREYRQGMEDACTAVVERLKEYKTPISGRDNLFNIAITSSNGDEAIAENVADIINQVGPSGIVEVLQSEMGETSYTVEDGYKFDRGYASSRFINDQKLGVCSYPDGDGKKGWVLCISDAVDDFKAIVPIIKHANTHGKFLVIIGKEFTEDVVRNCEKNTGYGVPVIPIIAPEFGNDMLFNLEDICIYVDTKVVAMAELKAATKGEVELPQLGQIDSIKVGARYTKLYFESAATSVAPRIKQLQNLRKEAENKRDQAKIDKRIAQLSSGLAIIKVGGTTPTEASERFDRYEDAVGATLAAAKEGVLPGGGVALAHAGLAIQFNSDGTNYANGWNTVLQACDAPYIQILTNADLTEAGAISDDYQMGIDATTGLPVNMIEKGIVDPYKVTATALNNAVSIASLVLSIGCVMDNTSVGIEE